MQPKILSLCICSLLFILCPALALAQVIAGIRILGSVKDAKTNMAIPYASVGVSGSSTGTVTNTEGLFTLYVPVGLQQGMLMISCMGYETQKFPVSPYANNANLQVQLKASSRNLKAVTVTTESAAQIVAHAYRNIVKNYPLSNTLYTGFYRESNIQSRQNTDTAGNYNYAVEAVVKMNKPSYRKPDPEGDIKLEQARKSVLMQQDSFIKWYGGVHLPLRADVVKKRADYIDPAHQKKYVYHLDGFTTYLDEPVFVISFKPGSKSLNGGVIYITTESYAIVKVTTSWIAPPNIRSINLIKGYSRNLEINYRPIGNKWYLQSLFVQNTGSERRVDNQFKIKAEYITTRIDTNQHQDFDYADKVQLLEVLSARQTPYDPNFWKDYNILAETHQLTALQLDTTKIDTTGRTKPQETYLHKARSGLNMYSVAKLVISGRLRGLLNLQGQTVSTHVNSLVAQYTSTQGQSVLNEQVSLPNTAIAVGVMGGLEYDVVKNLGIHYLLGSGYGSFNFESFSTGATYRINLASAKKRPVCLLFGMDYGSVTFSKKLNSYQYNTSPVKIGSQNFKDDISIQLFNSQKLLKPHLGFSIELNHLLSLFVQADYNIPLSQNDGLRFTSHTGNFFKDLFPKRKEVNLGEPGTTVNVNGKPVTQLPFKNNLTFTVGLNGLIRFNK